MSKIKTSDFDYHLPPELIAQRPFFPRDKCKLLVVDKKSGALQHRRFFEIANPPAGGPSVARLRCGDVLVLNNSKVFKARLYGEVKSVKCKMKSRVEIFLLRSLTPSLSPDAPVGTGLGGRGKERGSVWQVLGNPGKKLKPGVKVYFSKKIYCEVVEKTGDKYLARFNVLSGVLMKWVDKYGHVPVPPYIKQEPKKTAEYQTVYARHFGSVAAPTAGFHFTKNLLAKLRRRGVEVCYLTLHVGYGTFKPIKSEYIREHKMEAEWVDIPEAVAMAIARAKKEGRRIVAVGTTTVRALEGMLGNAPQPPLKIRGGERGVMKGFSGEVNLFITPGFKFKIVDALITNFHLPKSTLLLLVSAFAGRNNIIKAYQEAIERKYRFYSFGDAMLIV